MFTGVNLLPAHIEPMRRLTEALRTLGVLAVACSGLLGCSPNEVKERHAAAGEAYEAAPDTPEDAPYNKPERALGPPDGRTLAVPRGASLTLRFFRPVREAPGPDLRIYEVGPDAAEARVAVSLDGPTIEAFDEIATGPPTVFDLEELGLPRIYFVRIRGLDDAGEEPGYDVDALEALH